VVTIKKSNCRLENNGVTILTFWGHVTSSVTLPFDSRWSTLWVVHCDHASVLHRYGDNYEASNVGRTDVQVILYSVTIALLWTDNRYVRLKFRETQKTINCCYDEWFALRSWHKS